MATTIRDVVSTTTMAIVVARPTSSILNAAMTEHLHVATIAPTIAPTTVALARHLAHTTDLRPPLHPRPHTSRRAVEVRAMEPTVRLHVDARL